MKRLVSFIVCALFILTECVVLTNLTVVSQGEKIARVQSILPEEDKKSKGIKTQKEKGVPLNKK